MQHSAIVKKNENITIFTYTNLEDPYINVWKLDESGNFELLVDAYTVYQLNENYFKCTFKSPNDDCILCIKFGDFPTFVRVGNPKVRLMYYNDVINDTISYRQIDVNTGNIINEGTLLELEHGFYYKNIPTESYSIIEIKNSFGYIEPNILKLPYTTSSEPISGVSGYSATSNFLDVGLNAIGFLGNEKSKFDLGLKKWISSDSVVSASELAKAVCSRYGLEWNRTVPSGQEDLQPLWVGNYIKYIKTQDEEGGRALIYKPYITPETNSNNFKLIAYDELNNVQVKGLMILLNKPLEKLIDNSEGAIFDFKNN